MAWASIAIAIDGIADSEVFSRLSSLFERENFWHLPAIAKHFACRNCRNQPSCGDSHIESLFTGRIFLCTAKADREAVAALPEAAMLSAISSGCWAMLEAVWLFCDRVSGNIAQPLLAIGSFSLYLIIISSEMFDKYSIKILPIAQ